MAQWHHKVRRYGHDRMYSTNEHPFYQRTNWVVPTSKPGGIHMSIEQWLDWQCEDGWELFKFNEDGYCVFRKKI